MTPRGSSLRVPLAGFILTAVFLAGFLARLTHAPQERAAVPAQALAVWDEAMDSLSSHGTSLLSCLELRIETVCEELGDDSSECGTIRMATNRSLFTRVRDTNRCLDAAAQAKSPAACPMLAYATPAQLRAAITTDVTAAELRCSTFEDDSALQAIIDEAWRLKIARLAESDRLAKLRVQS